MYDLNGKKYLVTGASSGIGQSTAYKLSEQGAHLVLTGINIKRLQETKDFLQGDGHCVIPYDMRNLEGIKEFVSKCIVFDGKKFDGLVFSAGIGHTSLLRLEKVPWILEVTKINYLSFAVLLTEFASKRILNDGGSIVALSSSATIHADKSQGIYTATKAAIEGLCRVASKEFSNRGVRVNTVCPEMVRTPMTRDFFSNTSEKDRRALYPLGDIEPEDIAETVLFLLSNQSRKITGQKIYISSGNDGRPIEGSQLKI